MPFEANISTVVSGILFNQAPAEVLLGKVVSLNRALTAGAGFKMLGYCKLGKVVGMLAELSAKGQILYPTIPAALATGNKVLMKFECTASGAATGIAPPEARFTN
jgi:hypothetical protein